MSASNKFFNVVLIGFLGVVALGVSLYFLVGPERVVSVVYETGMEKLEAGDLESARLAFERALERSRDKAPAAYQLALLAAREDPAQGLPFVRIALDEGQPDGDALAGMTNLALRAEDTELALETLRRLQTVDPGHDSILPLRGKLAIVQRRYQDAISLFEELLSAGSASDEVKLALGQLLSRSESELDRTRAKVILLDAAEGKPPAATNAMLYIVSSGAVEMSPADWTRFFDLGMEKGFLNWPSVEENLPLLRRLMVLAAHYAPDLAPAIVERRVEHPEAGTPDFIDGAMIAQQERNLRRAEQLLESVPAEDQDSVGVLMLRAHQLILEGRPDAGMVELERVLNEHPDERAALPLLRELANAPEGTLSVREQTTLLELISKHPAATLEDRFAAYEGLLELRPLRGQEILREVFDRLGDKAPRQVASWFLNHGAPEFAEELITPERARTHGNLFELRLVALLRQEKLEAAEAMLDNRPPNLPTMLVTTGRLRLAMARRDLDKAREHWEAAVALADRQGLLPYFGTLANMALDFEARDLAQRAFQLAFERGAPLAETDWLTFTGLASDSLPLESQQAIAEAALRAYPNNPVFINNVCYLQLLRGLSRRENLLRMEELVDEHPNIDAFRVTLGLAYLKNDRANMAVRTLERIEMDWTPAGASAQAIYLAALAEGNRRDMAVNFARNVDTASLLPEERELIAPLLER